MERWARLLDTIHDVRTAHGTWAANVHEAMRRDFAGGAELITGLYDADAQRVLELNAAPVPSNEALRAPDLVERLNRSVADARPLQRASEEGHSATLRALRAQGFADAVMLKTHEGGGRYRLFSYFTHEQRRPAEAWAVIADHLGAAGRLRHQLDDAAIPDVLKITHRQPWDPADLWSALVDGCYSVLDDFVLDGARCLVLRMNATRDLRAMTSREADVARGLARALSDKVIAAELAISEKTVSVHVSALRVKMKAKSRADLVSTLAMFAQAERSYVDLGGERLYVVSARAHGLAGLSALDLAIVRALLLGHSNRDIALEVGRSSHTVANRLARLYRRFGLRCRADLARRWTSLR